MHDTAPISAALQEQESFKKKLVKAQTKLHSALVSAGGTIISEVLHRGDKKRQLLTTLWITTCRKLATWRINQ